MYIEVLELCAWTPPTPDTSSNSQALEDAELLQRAPGEAPLVHLPAHRSAVEALEGVVLLGAPVNNTCPHPVWEASLTLLDTVCESPDLIGEKVL